MENFSFNLCLHFHKTPKSSNYHAVPVYSINIRYKDELGFKKAFECVNYADFIIIIVVVFF